MEYFNHGIFSSSRRQLCGRETSVRNSCRSKAYTQTKKSPRRNVLTHFLSPKLWAVSSVVVICVILQVFHLCNDNGDVGCGLNFGNIEGRNLSQNNAHNRPGDKGRLGGRMPNIRESFLNSFQPEARQESGRCRYEEIETILGGSDDSNESDNKPYHVSIPDDESEEVSEDEWEVESEAGQSGRSEDEFEYSDEEEDDDDDDYEEIELLKRVKSFFNFGKSRKQDDADLIRFDADESLSEDSDTESESRKMLTEEELYRKLKRLKGNLGDAEMLYLWNSFLQIETNKFEVMQKYLWEWCELLAFEYKIPEDILLAVWKRIVDFSSDELLEKTVMDNRDFKQFVNDGLKDNMDFFYFLNSKREKWASFRSRIETVWKNTIENQFINYYK
ncbi:hypothetical protein AK88_00709 [Plasmodium fragile]|uniref:Plasmodium RESA N-terminal domain-containing protein n=1 Tax=Plasmodium fragile TaxID=5857 RepID=A0A0D9QQW0_PLAFR|nr:uncharacterized protein AK88_00709 [Plasmodium fragile]KJP89500.1 hypothetical protein AK88_00709 [Plasmodium fragile]